MNQIPDPGTILLYTLSTLAQTCAALAAFVGAVGIFRLQMLREQRAEAEREFRRLSTRAVNMDMERTPTKDILARLDDARQKFGETHMHVAAALEARDVWTRFIQAIMSSRKALVIFEAWNLLVIGVSLVGFNYVAWLASAPTFTFWALWAAAVGTVAVTIYCVIVWTRGSW